MRYQVAFVADGCVFKPEGYFVSGGNFMGAHPHPNPPPLRTLRVLRGRGQFYGRCK